MANNTNEKETKKDTKQHKKLTTKPTHMKKYTQAMNLWNIIY